MAYKYLISGATYCGDGTASNEAASAGAVGAWNNLNVLANTAPAAGTLASSDVVYIRSKTSAGADLTITNSTAAAYVGSSAGIVTGWVTWILDDGAVWSGINGTLTYTSSATWLTRAYNKFVSAQDAWKWVSSATSPSASAYFTVRGILENALIDFTAKTGNANAPIDIGAGILINPHVKYNRLGTTSSFIFSATNNVGHVQIINPYIEMTYSTGEGVVFGNYTSAGYRSLSVIGGRLTGSGATTGTSLLALTYANSDVKLVGFQFPQTVSLVSSVTGVVDPCSAYGIGADGGAGAFIIESWGQADSRDDGYYPTLDATLPYSTGDGWAWRVYPSNTDWMANREMKLPLAKLYTAAAASKTLTCNVLIADTMAYDKSNLWIDVHYIDSATGGPKYQRSKATGELATSTAGWSATTYGAVNLLKKSLSITTETSIKQDSMVTVILRGELKSASSNDILFVCPDVGIA